MNFMLVSYRGSTFTHSAVITHQLKGHVNWYVGLTYVKKIKPHFAAFELIKMVWIQSAFVEMQTSFYWFEINLFHYELVEIVVL